MWFAHVIQHAVVRTLCGYASHSGAVRTLPSLDLTGGARILTTLGERRQLTTTSAGVLHAAIRSLLIATAGKPLSCSPTVSLASLSLALLRLGAFAFGGMGGTLALLRSDLGARRGWITDHDVAEALAITQTLPGSTGVQVVAFLGWKLAGWPGALIAPFSFVAVPAVMMIAASAAVAALPDIAAVRGAILGVQIAIVGILAANMLRMARSAAKGSILSAVLVSGLLIGALVSAVVAVLALGMLGALLTLHNERVARHG